MLKRRTDLALEAAQLWQESAGEAGTLPGVESEMISHLELKDRSKNLKFAIRTGEFTPYPNIILRAGVAFPA